MFSECFALCNSEYSEEEPDYCVYNDDRLKIRLKDMSFYKSFMDEDFVKCNQDEKIVQDVLKNWFEFRGGKRVPSYQLYLEISRMSGERRRPHDPEWFQEHLSSVRFHYVNNYIYPYRYSIKN